MSPEGQRTKVKVNQSINVEVIAEIEREEIRIDGCEPSRYSSVGRAFVCGMTDPGFDPGLAAMLATKRSLGVAPEMNLGGKHVTHICPCQVPIRLPTLTLRLRGDITRSPKQGYQWPHRNDLCPPKILYKI